jgi:hypothetical protein
MQYRITVDAEAPIRTGSTDISAQGRTTANLDNVPVLF